MGEALSRILDPSELDACDKPRGRLVIEIPSRFAGAEIDVVIPPRVTVPPAATAAAATAASGAAGIASRASQRRASCA